MTALNNYHRKVPLEKMSTVVMGVGAAKFRRFI